ncbi:MAG TPA: hypothetical protein VIS57_02670 [Xanthomonadales bacterium]
MKAMGLLLISFLVLCVSTTSVVASEESDAAKIQRAMNAAPSSISAEAEIRDVDADWTIIRPGTNGWTCFPGVPVNVGDKHPMCNDLVWMEWLWAVKALIASNFTVWDFETEVIGTSYMLRGDALVNNDDPMGGDIGLWDQEGPHIMMLFPTLDEIADLPRDPNAGGPYVMWDETPLVHVMFPMTDRDR